MQPSPGPAWASPAVATPEPEVKDSVMADGDDEGWISVDKSKDKGRRSSSSPLRSSRRSESGGGAWGSGGSAGARSGGATPNSNPCLYPQPLPLPPTLTQP